MTQDTQHKIRNAFSFVERNYLYHCHLRVLKSINNTRLPATSGAFLPLREIRNCVPEFLTLNIFLYLTGHNTEEEI